MQPEVSVIVAVYNTENYLDRCVKSILSQSFTNFELILVDDGSKDSSLEMCQRWGMEDARVRVIHQENQGLSAARNHGTCAASANLVTYVDSDDYVEPYYLEYLFQGMQESGADCVCARSVREKENRIRFYEKPEFQCETWDEAQALSEIMVGRKTTVSSWNKLAPKAWYLNEPYFEGRLYEDLSNTYRILFQAKKIAFVDAVLYHYVMNPGSITSKKNVSETQCIDFFEAINLCTGASVEKYPVCEDAANALKAKDYMALFLMVDRCSVDTPCIQTIREDILKWYHTHALSVVKNRAVPKSVRIRILLMRISPALYRTLYYLGIRIKGIRLD